MKRIHGGSHRSLDDGACRRVQTREADLVVVRAGGTVFAFDNRCPHQQFAEFHRGELEGFHIRCPMHGWTFDVRNGASTTGEGRLRNRRVTLEGDDLWIFLE